MGFRRVGSMPPEEVFSRALFGVVLILSFFASWGRWAALVMGVLFLVSALSGVCLTCIFYRKFFGQKN